MTTDKEIMKKLNAYFSVDGNVTIENGFVNCSGSVTYIKVTYKKDEARQLPVQFKSVDRWFDCSDNRLTSLVGSPQSVGGHFMCSNNRLTSLTGAPQTVRRGFYCNDNQLTSLAGAPQTVDDTFNCGENQLTSLAGAPQSVGGYFICSDNQLTSLAGAPQTVGGEFDCSDNRLTSLVGSPQSVGGHFICTNNRLTSLAGAPRYIKGKFLLSYAKNLPLLPLLKIRGCNEVIFMSINTITNKDLSAILNLYLGTGTRGMLPCAMEMTKAGYGSNAKL